MGKVIGQEKVTTEIERIFDVFKASNGKIRPHFILTGQSGSGKSYSIKSLCKKKGISMIEINGAQLTKEGTSGNSLSKALAPIKNFEQNLVLVFVDEFDKLFISDNSNSSVANEVTIGVQNEFLKVLESDTTAVFGDYGHYDDIAINKCLFCFAGAFNNDEHITLDKLRKYGVKTEFLGRVGLLYNTKKLTLDDLYMILEQSELLDNYLKIFYDVDRNEVIKTLKKHIADNYENNTLGARMINTLINQYFIKGGELEEEEVEEVTFQTKLSIKGE